MPGKYNRKDHFYKEAKEQGYRSRASFKLVEAQKKYKLIKAGARVLDLGCWPGGWLQIAADACGAEGKVVGVDLIATEYSGGSNVITLQGDVREAGTLERCMAAAGGGAFDVVLSDMSPKLTGIREVDEQGTIECAQMALDACGQVLKKGGAVVIKVFKNSEVERFVKGVEGRFARTARAELDSSRKTSNEFYVIATGFKG